MKPIKKIIWAFLDLIKIGGPIQLAINSTIKNDGWFISFYSKKAVNRNNEPIPWFTYPSIKFIDTRLNKELDVFEFGCGNSTIWFANRVKSIVSVENDNEWIEAISPKMPPNSKIVYQPLEIDGTYSKECINQNRKFQVIIIDGRDRINCAKNCFEALSDDGVIIFDNSHTELYKPAADIIFNNGFKRIDFIGLTPIISHENTTTIFYRPNNCFNI